MVVVLTITETSCLVVDDSIGAFRIYICDIKFFGSAVYFNLAIA